MVNVQSSSGNTRLQLGSVPHSWIKAPGLTALAALLLSPITPARAEYRLHAGDVVEISIARLPELKQRVPVQLNGTISFPLMGTIPVADLLPSEMQAKVQAMLAAKVFRQRISDGRETSVAIEPNEVIATVVEYRPIYVDGDVAKPGEQPYRPLMTVRQSIALSGGYDVMRLRTNNPVLESADLKGEYESLWTQYAKEQAHVWRLKQELNEPTTFDQKQLLDVPIPPSTAQAIVDAEAQNLKARQADQRAERTFLQQGITEADEQIKVLSEQQSTEIEGNQADIADLQRAKDLFGRGTLTSIRVTDARRAMLLSSVQRLQTTAQLMQTKRQRDDLTRQLERLEGQRRSDLLRELEDAIVALSTTRSKLQSVGEKLQYAGLAKSQLARGLGNKPSISIVRSGIKGTQTLAASEDDELQPGDVIEVALRDELGAELSSR